MSANVSDNDVPPERSTTGWEAHPEHPNVERYWDGQRWSEHRFASGIAGAPPHPHLVEAPAASLPAPDRGPQQFTGTASVGEPSRAQDQPESQTRVPVSVAAGPVQLGRTMGIAGACALVPLAGNAVSTLLTGRTGRASWLVVPAVGVIVAMITAGIQAYGSSAGAQRPTNSDAHDPQRPGRRRFVRGETSLAVALIVVVVVFGFGGLAVSEGTRYAVTELRATIRDNTPAASKRPSPATEPAPRVAARPPAPARARKPAAHVVTPPPAPAPIRKPAATPPLPPTRAPTLHHKPNELPGPPLDSGAEPALQLQPTTGQPDSWISVSGGGFQPGERVVIQLSTIELGATRTDARGRFSNKRVQIPSHADFPFAGQQQIAANGDASLQHVTRPFYLQCPEGYKNVLGSCAAPGETGGAP